MPLTTQESIGLGVGVLNIWDKYVDVDSMRQLDLLRKQYVDESIIAYVRRDHTGFVIKIVNIEEFRCLRRDITKII